MDIDSPWIADPLRDLGDRRKQLFDLFRAALDKRGITYTIIRGDYCAREEQVVSAVDALLGAF